MSQSDAKTPESVEVVGIFGSISSQGEKDEKRGQTTEVKVKEGSEVKESRAKEVTSSSKLEVNVAKGDAGGGDKEEPTNDIESLFGPDSNLNEDEIAVICKFLHYKDLKSVRQVDTVWSAGATPIFVRKSVVVLESGKTNKEIEGLKDAAKNLNLSGLTAIKIILEKEIVFEKEAELFNDILQKLSPNLKSFELERLPNEQYFLPRATIQFPVLTSIKLTENFSESEELTRRFFALFYTSAPNLTQLIIDHFNSGVISPLRTDDGSRNWSLVPKFKSLSVSFDLSPESLSTLINFPQTWESLDLELLVYGDDDELADIDLLSQLLEKNKDSLLSLKLDCELGNFEAPAILNFPTSFSKLQKLKLSLVGHGKGAQFNFGPNPINYSKTFPSLTSLKVTFYLDQDDSVVFRNFLFPPQVFKGLQDLELKFRDDYTAFLENEGIAEDWTERMFPNAKIEIN